jgi:hypothetical protein
VVIRERSPTLVNMDGLLGARHDRRVFLTIDDYESTFKMKVARKCPGIVLGHAQLSKCRCQGDSGNARQAKCILEAEKWNMFYKFIGGANS